MTVLYGEDTQARGRLHAQMHIRVDVRGQISELRPAVRMGIHQGTLAASPNEMHGHLIKGRA